MKKDAETSATTQGEQPVLKSTQEYQSLPSGRANLFSVSQQTAANGPSTRGSSCSVELHIEELALQGFANCDRYSIGELIERELTQLFAEGRVPPAIAQGGEIARIDGGALDVPPDSNSETTAAQLAKVIYRGLGK